MKSAEMGLQLTGTAMYGVIHLMVEELKYGYDLSAYDLPDKRKALRNAVNPEMGLHILRHAL